VWSDWSEAAELFVGPTLAMLQSRGHKALVMEHENPLSVDQLLVIVSREIENLGTSNSKRSRRMRIVLSGALCPALTFAVPNQVTRWAERMEIARATAALAMGTAPDQLVCEMDEARAGVASAMTIRTQSVLHGWAAEHQFAITSIQPLWAIASQSRAAHDPVVQGLIVMEPDANTVLADAGAGKVVAVTQAGRPVAADAQAHTRRLLVGLGLRESALLKLAFDAKPRAVMQYGPKAWPNHWYSP